MTDIAKNLLRLQTQIEQFCQNANRTQHSVTLLAVSKTKPVDAILCAHKQGQSAFGENYVQEGVEKIRFFKQQGIDLEWHFIGPLQSNKTRLIAENFDWMQTLDRKKIADRLNAQRPHFFPPLNVLIQINISNEISKSGISPEELIDFAEYIQKLPHLCLRGLMAIPAPTDDTTRQKRTFEEMHRLFEQLKQRFPDCTIDTLSMGMSDDMENAIYCGSTMIRIGTALFGKREKPISR